MVASTTERRVFLWHMVASPKPNEAIGKVAVTMDDTIGLLEAEWTAKRARVFLAKDSSRIVAEDDPKADPKNQIYIADMRRDAKAKTVTLLFNRGDPNTVSPGFIDIAAGSVRTAHPRAPETPGWSAHMVISLEPKDGRYRACFEQMPKVSSSLVETAIERILGAAIETNPEFTYEVSVMKKGKPKIERRRYRPVLNAARVPSENLIDDLDRGQLSAVTLSKRKRYYSGVGEADVIRFQEEKIVIHTKPADKSKVVEALQDVIEQAKNDGYEKISFHLDKLPGNQTNNPTLSLADQDALEQLYVRAHRLDGFSTVLVQCYPTICDDIADKMIAVVNSTSAW